MENGNATSALRIRLKFMGKRCTRNLSLKERKWKKEREEFDELI
jgi:hypothetical protein